MESRELKNEQDRRQCLINFFTNPHNFNIDSRENKSF